VHYSATNEGTFKLGKTAQKVCTSMKKSVLAHTKKNCLHENSEIHGQYTKPTDI
jgi:hypothetical protein